MEEFNKLNILQKRKMAIEDLVKYYADYNNKLVTRVCYDDRYKNNGQGSRDVPCKSINGRIFRLMCMGVDTSCVSCKA